MNDKIEYSIKIDVTSKANLYKWVIYKNHYYVGDDASTITCVGSGYNNNPDAAWTDAYSLYKSILSGDINEN